MHTRKPSRVDGYRYINGLTDKKYKNKQIRKAILLILLTHSTLQERLRQKVTEEFV